MTALSQLGSVPPATPADALLGPAPGTRDAGVVSREFAAVIYSIMLAEMQKTVPQNPYLSGKGEEMYRSLLVNQLGRQMAGRKGDPLAAMIRESLEKQNAGKAQQGEA